MDKLGVDTQVMHNSFWIKQVTDREDVEVALCMSWNRWIADIWKQGKGRLRWSCVVPAMTLNETLQQIRFAKQNGSVGVCLRPFEAGRHLVDPYFYPIYEEATRLDMAIVIHIANADPQLCELFSARGGFFSVFRIPTVMTCFSLLMSEIPYVFPKLRWGFIESSAQWVPWVVNESIRRSAGSERKHPDNPLHAFRVYVSAQTDDDFPFVLKYSGEDRIVIGTDYGHMDPGSEVDALTVFRANTAVSDAQKRKVLSDNPKALYGL